MEPVAKYVAQAALFKLDMKVTVTPPTCPTHGEAMLIQPGKFGRFWSCPHWSRNRLASRCEMLVGAHRSDGRALGTPANRETRLARRRAHVAFDTLWKGAWDRRSRRRCRTKAYQWLAAQLGIHVDVCHIAAFDRTTCDRVENLVRSRTQGWHRDRQGGG